MCWNPLMNTTPPSLLERVRQPADQEAWARLVALYTPLICYWARRVGLQDQDAVDLAQDVFTVLVRKLPEFKYDRHKSFRGWLRAITLNKWREKLRRESARREEGDGALAELAAPDEGQTFWETEYRQHLAARALKLMQAEFQPTTWKACWEVVVSGRPAAEVADELQITLGAVYAAKSRVLRRLRQELAGLLD